MISRDDSTLFVRSAKEKVCAPIIYSTFGWYLKRHRLTSDLAFSKASDSSSNKRSKKASQAGVDSSFSSLANKKNMSNQSSRVSSMRVTQFRMLITMTSLRQFPTPRLKKTQT